MEGYIEIGKYQQLQAQAAALKAVADLKIADLTFQLEQLKRMVFGATSERFVPIDIPEQLNLFGEIPSTPIEVVKQTVGEHERTKTKKKPARLVLSEHLPREEYVIEPDIDTSNMVKIGEERTETLVYTPAKLYIKVIIRPQYAEKPTTAEESTPPEEWEETTPPEGWEETSPIHIAELPKRFINKCIADESLLAAIITDKFVDHLPLVSRCP